MKNSPKFFYIAVAVLFIWGCNRKPKPSNSEIEQRKKIEMVTDYGTMIIELYNETPLHQENFIKLANENAYDSVLFHRVIKAFMIQAGDPNSKRARPGDTLGAGDKPYTIQAEFHPDLFHKKGALAAAREDNPDKVSSGMQFYIVQGTIKTDTLLANNEKYINVNSAKEYYEGDPMKKDLIDSIQSAIDSEDSEQYTLFTDSIINLAQVEHNFKPYKFPESHRDTYKKIGGAPYLDQTYTVFGEVVKGIGVLDSIAAVKTDSLDRPIFDLRIKTVKVIE